MPIFLENPCDRFGILSKRQKKIMCKKNCTFFEVPYSDLSYA